MHTKLFFGIKLTSDLKNHLAKELEPPLKHIPWEEKEYLGFYLENASPNVTDIHKSSLLLSDLLSRCLPEVRTDKLHLLLFPQYFLG